MRRLFLLPAILVAAALLAVAPNPTNQPAYAPKKTTTTGATTTTTIAPTTTVAPTTTTTTVAGCVPGTPVTVIAGGVYSGCYRSTDPAVPAVTINTTAPVTLDHARVEHAGIGVRHGVFGTQFTTSDSTYQRLDPGGTFVGRAIWIEQPASFTATYNRLVDGDGIIVYGVSPATSGPVLVANNDATDIGRYPHPTGSNCCVQFLQLAWYRSASIEVAWNRVVNTPGASDAEDVINFYESGGTDASHRSNVHHNLTDGSYDRSLSGDDSGSGINIGDAGDAQNFAHDNVMVSVTNAGLGLSHADNYADSNLVVSDGAPQADINGQAVVAFENVTPPGAHATATRYNFRRSLTDPNQYPCYQSQYCSGGVQVGLTEQDARDEWEAARVAAGITVGPR